MPLADCLCYPFGFEGTGSIHGTKIGASRSSGWGFGTCFHVWNYVAWNGIWDQNKDGVMEGSQHNTMDMNYVGPNPQMAGWYLGALRASEKMARHLGDRKFEKECKTLYDDGRKWIDANIFNGEYYEQKIQDGAEKVAQLGKGCLVDQLVGQYLVHTAGLGYVLDKEKVRTALKNIMKYNYISDFNDHFNAFRSYGLGDESGLLMASYPHGDLLDFPFPYYTEIMTGFEYSTAAHMIYEGQEEDGLKIFHSIRDRFDGYKRNPFNEGEYGHRYARAMAAWAGILAYTKFLYSAVDKKMVFSPRDGKYFWSNGYNYGVVSITSTGKTKGVLIEVMNGNVEIEKFDLYGFGYKN